MRTFDSEHPDIREIMRATSHIGSAIRLYNAGVRTFAAAERAVAKGETGRAAPLPAEVAFPVDAPEGERLRRGEG